MAIARDPVRDNPGHRSARTEQCLGGGKIAALAEHRVHQGAIAVHGPVQIPPQAVDFDKRLVDVPAAADVAASTVTEFLRHAWGEFRLPIPHRLVAKYDAADQEHLGKIAQAELVAEAPEHHERDDVARVLRPVQQAGAALNELPAAAALRPC